MLSLAWDRCPDTAHAVLTVDPVKAPALDYLQFSQCGGLAEEPLLQRAANRVKRHEVDFLDSRRFAKRYRHQDIAILRHPSAS